MSGKQPIYQLDPPIPVFTDMGAGYCVAWIDYSQEHDTIWKVCLNATGEFWDLPQSRVRGQTNISMGRHGQATFDKKPC
jgi:hypothetical protein